MLHEERTANILINKAGENAGPDANGYRVALPSAWMKDLGISEGSRTVTLQFDGESITIRRPAVSDYNVFLANACVEIMPYSGGLNRNIVQCLEDFATMGTSSVRRSALTKPLINLPSKTRPVLPFPPLSA